MASAAGVLKGTGAETAGDLALKDAGTTARRAEVRVTAREADFMGKDE
jgi:hypothetical protein